MFRLLGFLIGSVSSIVIILLIVGMPNFRSVDQEVVQQRYDAAIEQLRAKQHQIDSTTGQLAEDVARVAESVEENIEPVTEVVAAFGDAIELSEEETPTARPAPDQLPTSDLHTNSDNDVLWYSFWNPFRSEIAANGFVSQLEKVTGLDYRVVKVKSGVYEVAFAYNDDMERHTKLTQISAATGLELPDT